MLVFLVIQFRLIDVLNNCLTPLLSCFDIQKLLTKLVFVEHVCATDFGKRQDFSAASLFISYSIAISCNEVYTLIVYYECVKKNSGGLILLQGVMFHLQ